MGIAIRRRLWPIALAFRRFATRVRFGGRRPPICDDVQQWARATAGTEAQIIFPPRAFTRQLPKTVDPSILPAYRRRTEGHFRGRYVVPVHNARLVGKDGLVVLADGQYAGESFYNGSVLRQQRDYYAPKRRPRVGKRGAYFPVMIVHWASPANYYHWMHDSLTRLFGVLPMLPNDTTFIVSPDMSPSQRETLELLGISSDRIVPFDVDEVWELETLYFAPPTMWSGCDRPEVDLWLRDELLAALGITPNPAGRRIYVSRREAATRRVANENDVEALLRAYGFETHVTEALSLREQAELFAGAELLVAPHGAGNTNMLFSPQGLRVVEMIEPGMLENAYIYWSMADALGHEYWYLLGESVPGPGGQNSMRVPVEKLGATLDRMNLRQQVS